MQVKFSQARRMAIACIKTGLVPNIIGSPGIGKSQLAYSIAEEFGLKLIDIRLSQCDPTDLMGFPSLSADQTKAGYKPMETFPVVGDKIPDGYTGWLIFLDEFNSAPPAVQAAAYKLVLDRMVGIHPLHKNVAIMCAGNLETDGAIVQPLSTALQSRLVHFELVVDHAEWLNWAYVKGVDHRITDHIKFKPGNLYTFRSDHTDHTYGSPRTWEFANRLLGVTEEKDPDRLALFSGCLSEGLAREFIAFCQIYREVPKPEEIRAHPESTKVPSEPSFIYAITGSIAHNADKDSLAAFMKYIYRLPKEFQVVTLREIVRRGPEMIDHPATRQWMSSTAVELF